MTVSNIASLEFGALVDLMHDIYCKEIPAVDIGHSVDLPTLSVLMIFFSNQYSYTAELWAIMLYEVRNLKRMKATSEAVDEAMAKRDFMKKVMSACKLKYYAASRLLMHMSKTGGE